jgi:hypothetical protein
MGQYYYVINIDKGQYLHPHRFGDGLKLLEFSSSGSGTMLGLAILLADGNGRGGGDLQTANEKHDALVGSWLGDRIVIAGNYADPGHFLPEGAPGDINLHHYAQEHYQDISRAVIEILMDDPYIKQDLVERGIDPETYCSRWMRDDA